MNGTVRSTAAAVRVAGLSDAEELLRVFYHDFVAVPPWVVCLAGWGPDALTSAWHDGLAVAGASQPDSVGAHQQLTVGVRMPVGARAGDRGEPNVYENHLRRAVAGECRVHPNVAGKI
jgi:hypothetical protein